jgi:hypothetical protein
VLVMRERRRWWAIVGVPLLAQPGSTLVVDVVHGDGRRESANIRVGAKSYAEQHLTIPPERADLWLAPGEAPAELLSPPVAGLLVATEVSPRVNSARHDDPACLEPVAPARPPEPPRQGRLF